MQQEVVVQIEVGEAAQQADRGGQPGEVVLTDHQLLQSSDETQTLRHRRQRVVVQLERHQPRQLAARLGQRLWDQTTQDQR